MILYTIAIFGIGISVLGGLLSTISLIVSIVSWINISRWRNLRNYIFLCIMITFNADYLIPLYLITMNYRNGFENYYSLEYHILDVSLNFFMFSGCSWLMLMAMNCYGDLVDVFRSNMTRRYLKCNLFGWTLPLTMTVVKIVNRYMSSPMDVVGYQKLYHDLFYYEEVLQNVLLIVLLAMNFFVYLKVVLSLRNVSIVTSSGQNRVKKMKLATFVFIMSGVLLLVSIFFTVLMTLGEENKYYFYPIGLIASGVHTTIVNIYFLSLKSNYNLWKQYYMNK